jgi:hypothetical protein
MYSKHSELFQLLAQAAQNRDLSFLDMAADYLESETNFHGNTYLAREAESYAVKLRLEEPIKGITDRYLYWFVWFCSLEINTTERFLDVTTGGSNMR